MTDQEFNIKLQELQSKHTEAERLQAHRFKTYIYWASGVIIGTAALAVAATTLILKLT